MLDNVFTSFVRGDAITRTVLPSLLSTTIDNVAGSTTIEESPRYGIKPMGR